MCGNVTLKHPVQLLYANKMLRKLKAAYTYLPREYTQYPTGFRRYF
jgi:hypothetical protein